LKIIIFYKKDLKSKIKKTQTMGRPHFNGKKRGIAIEITKSEYFNNPVDPRELFLNFVPPRSFCYVDMLIEPEETKNE